jgi:hypothetical protein
VKPFEPLLSVPAVAKRAGRSYRSMLRLILRLHAEDVRLGEPTDWLVRPMLTSKLRVNMSRLEVAHPALFRKRYVDREEYDEILARIDGCETQDKELNKRIGAVGARVRALESVKT